MRPAVHMRAANDVTMSLNVVQDAGANMVALVPQAGEVTLGIGANAPGFGGDGTFVFVIALIAIASVAARNGTGGTPGSGGRVGDAYVPRTTPNGVEMVRFPPTMGGPERPAAGSQGVGLLLAGFFPTIIEISRVMNLPMS